METTTVKPTAKEWVEYRINQICASMIEKTAHCAYNNTDVLIEERVNFGINNVPDDILQELAYEKNEHVFEPSTGNPQYWFSIKQPWGYITVRGIEKKANISFV